jgi:hypothetical protein
VSIIMKTTQRLALLITATTLCVAGCDPAPVRTDTSAGGVTRCHGFAWLEAAPGDSRPASAFDNPLNDQRVKDAVTRALVLHGIQPVEGTATPDCLAGRVVGAGTEPKKHRFSIGVGVGVGGGSGGGALGLSTGTGTSPEGRIAIDLFDAVSREPLWHGAAQVDVEHLTGEDAQQRIEAAVQKMFERFPARP